MMRHYECMDDAQVITVALVDDEELVRQGLQALMVNAGCEVRPVISTPRWAELLDDPQFPVDVVLLDYKLDDGVPAASKVRLLRAAGVACLIVSTHATPAEVRTCIGAGALGYLPKSEPPDKMIKAIRAVARGDSYVNSELATLLVADREYAEDVPRLSPQELAALTLYASGLPMKSVARRIGVTYDTAKGYIDRVREKYELAGRSARTKVELYRRAVEDGFV